MQVTPSWKLVARLAQASADAYKFQSVWDSKTNAAVNVTCDGNVIIVAFKGSQQPEDFIQDAKFIRVGCPLGGEVHAGFWQDATAIAAQVLEQVKSFMAANPAAPVIITGHSLGGAQATIFAKILVSQAITPEWVVTFGEPRSGDEEFAAACDHSFGDVHLRVVNENDIVPRLPGVELGFRHSGHEAFMAVGGQVVIDPSPFERLASDIEGFGEAVFNLSDVLVNDHFIAAYENQIAEILKSLPAEPLVNSHYDGKEN